MKPHEIRELLFKAHGEIDQTLDRMKTWNKRLEALMLEVQGDIDALTEIQVEIEALAEDEERKAPVDEMAVAKAHRELRDEIESIITNDIKRVIG